jgi:4,5-DOPA dioxygenase extradiol
MIMSKPRQPAIFLGHGSPMNALEDNQFTRRWGQLGLEFGQLANKPKAILMISAHWMSEGVKVTAMTHPKTIHDFGGFPPALFAMRYPAPGSPDLAQRVTQLLATLPVMQDQDWGLDHGTWSVLVKMFPEADIPVVQLSLDLNENEAFHFELGRRLASLREEGVMIMASGNVVHNLRRLDPRVTSFDWAQRFNNAIRDAILSGEFTQAINYHQFGSDAQLSVPTNEHYLPLLYILGAKHPDDQIRIESDEMVMGAISMISVILN